MSESTCQVPWKQAFRSRREAERAARRLGHRAYRCEAGHWHITSRTSQEFKAVRESFR